MPPVNTPDKRQLPAVSHTLASNIDAAIACLQCWARANGQKWEGLTDPDALLFQSLLTKSKKEISRGTAPIFPRSTFKDLLEEDLTGRRWVKFLRWFAREIEGILSKTCDERSLRMTYPGRTSNGNGGRGAKGQAIYFLSFERPAQLPKPYLPRVDSEVLAAKQPDPPDTKESSSTARSDPVPRPGHTPQLSALHASEGVTVSIPNVDQSGSPVAWIVAMAAAFVVMTAIDPVPNPLADQFLRVIAAVREVLSGAVIVRL